MLQRIAYGASVIIILLGLIAADAVLALTASPTANPLAALLARGSVVPLTAAILALIAAGELHTLLARTSVAPLAAWATIAAVALVLTPWFSAAGLLGNGWYEPATEAHMLFVLVVALLGAAALRLVSRDLSGALTDIAGTWLIILYAGLLPSFMVLLRCDTHLPAGIGAWVILMFVAVCKASDIGAYFLGSWFGRHKLIPHVSPGKSVEGLFGGILASCSVSLCFVAIYRHTFPTDNPATHLATPEAFWAVLHECTSFCSRWTMTQAIIFGAVMSLAGQLGDLIESAFKRSAGAKDSASLIPGFGGILDMVDSPFAAGPVAWFLLTQVWDAM